MKELIDLRTAKGWIVDKWRNSLGYILCILLGVVVGVLTVEWRVVDDCRYLKAFRFGSQAFTCVRTI